MDRSNAGASQNEWRWGKPPISRQQVEDVAAGWGVPFPEDYILFAQDHHGARPKFKTIDIPSRKGAVFQSLLEFRESPRQDGDAMSILEMFDAVADRLPANVFPFGKDPFGNLYCFDYRESESIPKCVFWDHERASANPEKAIWPVCDNFSQLIAMLH